MLPCENIGFEKTLETLIKIGLRGSSERWDSQASFENHNVRLYTLNFGKAMSENANTLTLFGSRSLNPSCCQGSKSLSNSPNMQTAKDIRLFSHLIEPKIMKTLRTFAFLLSVPAPSDCQSERHAKDIEALTICEFSRQESKP